MKRYRLLCNYEPVDGKWEIVLKKWTTIFWFSFWMPNTYIITTQHWSRQSDVCRWLLHLDPEVFINGNKYIHET